MIKEQITVTNKLGLHTRAAAKLVALASKFESKIELQHNNQTANCKSIMALIVLGLTKGVTVTLVVEGSDELEAAEEIKNLFANRFGEAE